ncbi:calcium-binding protein [Bernardetia sp. Wsw4-3y2]|uniref:calcium-binding protein n=1 Tax=Bernardetia sp. Wsw4-3y2 TaxID=3127471 RepID=UPI0030D2ACAE
MPLTRKEIKEIIENEIIVDCYTDEEAETGWATYMEDNLNFPFEAEYLVRKASKPNEWKKVKIIENYTNSSNYEGGDFYLSALLEDVDMIIPVEIGELRNVEADEQTLDTLQIWKSKDKY